MSFQSVIFRCYDWKCLYFSQLFSPCILNTYTHQSVIMASQANEGASGSKDAKQNKKQNKKKNTALSLTKKFF